jgi:hypothetical protein
LFFTRLPLPTYCGGRHASHPCGWVDRAPD